MVNRHSLDVVIALRNRPEIFECARSLLTIAAVSQILIVDSNSTCKATRESLEGLASNSHIRVISQKSVRQFNKAQLLNMGLRESKAKFVLVSDADIIWNSETVDCMLRKARQGLCYVHHVVETRQRATALARPRCGEG